MTATNTYKGICADVGLQFESQMTMGQIQEYLMDCNGGISFKNNMLSIVNREEDDTLTAHYFRFEEGKDALWYSMSKVTKEVDGTIHYTEPPTITENLAANSVNGFAVGLKTNPQGYTTAKVTLSFSKGSKYYSGEQNIFIRNKVKTSTDLVTLLQQVCTK